MKRTHSLTASFVISLSSLLACGAAPDGTEDPTSTELGSSEQELTLGSASVATVSKTSTALIGKPPIVVIKQPPIIWVPLATGDLVLDGVMRYYGGGTATLGLQINVSNIGDSPATAASGMVSINGTVLTGALYQYYGGTATTPNTVNPGQRGYIKVEVPTAMMAPCTPYTVKIDLGHTMQYGDASVFNNDTSIVTTVCPLTWTTPIGAVHLGHQPDVTVAGKKLGDIVSSVVSGRPDGALCSSCHNSGSSYPYHPNVPANAAQTIDPFLNISGNESWACSSNTWASQFIYLPVAKYPHTEFLKEVVAKWRDDGALR